MAIRKLLLPLRDLTEAEPGFATATMVCRLWNAHLAVLYVAADKHNETAVREGFTNLATKNSLVVSEPSAGANKVTTSLSVILGRDPDIVAYHARLADLVVVPHAASTPDAFATDALHAVLFDSGRPVLIAPHIVPGAVGTRICLGWNGSAESASAVQTVLPWLPRAQAIRILWSDAYQRRGPLAPDLEAYLAAHGLTADQAEFKPVNKIVGAGLLAAANEFACDLLVMGAYSQSRMRQRILGGVTRHVLERANLPVIMHR